MTLPRLQNGWEVSQALQDAMPLSPIEQARRFWYDTLVYDEDAIAYLMKIYGVRQVMMGTDYPFVIRDRHPGKRFDGLGLSQEDLLALTDDNCLRFLGLMKP